MNASMNDRSNCEKDTSSEDEGQETMGKVPHSPETTHRRSPKRLLKPGILKALHRGKGNCDQSPETGKQPESNPPLPPPSPPLQQNPGERSPGNFGNRSRRAFRIFDNISRSNRSMRMVDSSDQSNQSMQRANNPNRSNRSIRMVDNSNHSNRSTRTADNGNRSTRSMRTADKNNRSSRSMRMADSSTMFAPESPGSFEAMKRIKRILAPMSLSPGTPDATRKPKVNIDSLSLPFLAAPTGSKHRQTLKSGQAAAAVADIPVPALYKYARKGMWDEFANTLQTSTDDEIFFANKKDGTNIMHLVVMSKTNYMKSFNNSSQDFEPASDHLLETLLQKYPGLASVRCSMNGYTPLTYACLVCGKEYDVERVACMVGLFLLYCPDTIYLFTRDGLSPIDIHVASYSHHHQKKEDTSRLGRTSGTVLRTLLTHSPELARSRIQNDRITGPLELLYKCNAKSFFETAISKIQAAANDDSTIQSDTSGSDLRKNTLDTMKKWWIWSWTIMILKHGSMKERKRGTPFAAVHAAAMQPGCPAPLMQLTMYVFPRQIKEPISDKDDLANLPLYAVCSWPVSSNLKGASHALLDTRKSQSISKLLEAYPLAVRVFNGKGETALELAAKSGTTWEGGVRRLVKAHPKALRSPSKQTGLYPFMTAAASADPSAPEDCQTQYLRTIYGLLRSNPKVLLQLLATDESTG